MSARRWSSRPRRLPDARGRPADVAAAGLDLRLPEARLGVLRPGRLRAVRAAVHDRAAVQLRRDRRAPGAARHGRHERQRQARPEPCRARSRAQGPQGPGPAAHPRRGQPGPALHLRRRPRPRDPARMESPARSTRTSTFRPRPRRPCSNSPRIWARSMEHGTVPLRLRPAVRARRAVPHPRRGKASECSGSRRRRLSTRSSTRSSRGSETELEAGPAVTESDLPEELRGSLREREAARRTASGARSSGTCSDGSSDARVLDLACDPGYFIRFVTAGERWATDIRDVSSGAARRHPVRERERLGAQRRPADDYFGMVFMSNYLEHLRRCGH